MPRHEVGGCHANPGGSAAGLTPSALRDRGGRGGPRRRTPAQGRGRPRRGPGHRDHPRLRPARAPAHCRWSRPAVPCAGPSPAGWWRLRVCVDEELRPHLRAPPPGGCSAGFDGRAQGRTSLFVSFPPGRRGGGRAVSGCRRDSEVTDLLLPHRAEQELPAPRQDAAGASGSPQDRARRRTEAAGLLLCLACLLLRKTFRNRF